LILTTTTVVVLEGFRFAGFPIFVDEVVVVRIRRHVRLESRTGRRRIGGRASDRREGVEPEGGRRTGGRASDRRESVGPEGGRRSGGKNRQSDALGENRAFYTRENEVGVTRTREKPEAILDLISKSEMQPRAGGRLVTFFNERTAGGGPLVTFVTRGRPGEGPPRDFLTREPPFNYLPPRKWLVKL